MSSYYTENYKTLLRPIEEYLSVHGLNTQICKDVSSAQVDYRFTVIPV